MSVLIDRLLEIHDALRTAEIPHAFGGAIALAFCVAEPRGTRDLDVNLFIETARADEAFAALPSDVVVTDANRQQTARDDQVRVWWDDLPIDLFFECHDFHREVSRRVRIVDIIPGRPVPVIDCGSLAVFKGMFNRTRDWADLEAVVERGTLDFDWALGWLHRLLGPDDEACVRFAGLRSRN